MEAGELSALVLTKGNGSIQGKNGSTKGTWNGRGTLPSPVL